jgi:Mn2+/Fe2+ NRAMP family transporter
LKRFASVEWLAAKNFWRLRRNFFLDIPFIEPLRSSRWTAVINGLLAPPLLVLIMLVSNNRNVMGQRVNGLGLNILGWAATAVMFAAAIGLFLTWGD